MVNRLKNSRDKDERKGFTYHERDPKKMKERAEQKGGTFDSIFQNGVDTWRPPVGDNQIRILPPTWDGAEHYGLDVYVHSYVGPDGSTYLCPKKMKGDRCPICEAAADAKAAGEDEDAKDLAVKKQVLVYILDRKGDDPDKPLVWAMSWTMDRDIAALCNNKRTGKILNLDHPDKGYDVFFKRTGTKLNTRYIGIQVDRDSTPILDKERDQDDLMDDLNEKPLDTVLKYYDEDYLEKVMSGTSEKKSNDEEEDDRDRDRGRRGRDRDDDRGGGDREERTERVGRRGRDDDKDKDREDDRGSSRRGRDRDDERDHDDDRDRGRRGRDDDGDKDDGGDDRYDKDGRVREDADERDRDDDRGRGRRGRDDDRDRDDDRGRDRDDDRGSRDRGRDRDRDDDRGSSRRGRDRDDEKDPADEDPKDAEDDSRGRSRRGRDDDGDKDEGRGRGRRGRDDDGERTERTERTERVSRRR